MVREWGRYSGSLGREFCSKSELPGNDQIWRSKPLSKTVSQREKKLPLMLGAALLLVSTSYTVPKGWEPLLDENLSKWGNYESYRH